MDIERDTHARAHTHKSPCLMVGCKELDSIFSVTTNLASGHSRFVLYAKKLRFGDLILK